MKKFLIVLTLIQAFHLSAGLTKKQQYEKLVKLQRLKLMGKFQKTLRGLDSAILIFEKNNPELNIDRLIGLHRIADNLVKKTNHFRRYEDCGDRDFKLHINNHFVS